MKFPARTCCRVAGFGIGVVTGGPLAGALGGYLGDVMHDFIGDVLGDSDELGEAISGMVGNVTASFLPKPWVADDAPDFNHDFRRAMLEALAIALEGGVVQRYAKEVNVGGQRKELLQRSFSKLSAHLRMASKAKVKKRDADGFMELFPGHVPDTDLLRLQEDGSEVSTEILGSWYDAVLAPMVVTECAVDLPKFGGEVEFRRQTVAALAEEFGPAFGRVLKDPNNIRLRIATARLMINQVLTTVRSSDGKLVGVADQLSAFIAAHKDDADLSARVIAGIVSLEERLGRIEATGEDTNQRMRRTESTVEASHQLLEEHLAKLIQSQPIQKYRQNLYERFRVHNTIGIPAVEDPKQKQGPDFIDDLFVQPTCTEQRVSPEDMDAALREKKKSAKPLLKRLEDERRVVLLADPGMGKSTLIQWLVTGMTAPTALKGATWLSKCLPVPIILREVVGALPANPEEWSWSALLDAFLQHKFDSTKRAMAEPLASDEEAWRTLLGSPQSWFLIDGLDEIGDPERRRALRDAIWEGFDSHPEARFLITSRVVGYDEAVVDRVHRPFPQSRHDWQDLGAEWEDGQLTRSWVVEDDGEPLDLSSHSPRNPAGTSGKRIFFRWGTLLYLAPWDNGQQETFADHWFELRMGKVNGAVRAREFVEAVRSHSSTGVVGRVPNLLLLMALLYRFRASLPHGRAKVYGGISQAYLDGIDAARRLNDRLLPYTLPEKERLLAIIAMHMQVRRAGGNEDAEEKELSEILVSMSDLREWLCPEFGGEDDAENQEQLEKFLQHIAARSGLLLPRGIQEGEEHFAFAHLSFQEFYAGCWLEREFRRLLNLKAGGGYEAEDLLFGDAPEKAPPAPLAVAETDFATFAAQPVWRESLLFLAERLAGSAEDTKTFSRWAFAVKKDTPLPEEAQALLATMSVDPQVNFPPE